MSPFLKNNLKKRIVYFWQCWVLVVARGVWGLSLQPEGFSLVVMRKRSFAAACGILVPWLGIEPSCPALDNGFLSAGPPRNSPTSPFFLGWFLVVPSWCCSHLDLLSTRLERWWLRTSFISLLGITFLSPEGGLWFLKTHLLLFLGLLSYFTAVWPPLVSLGK